MIGKRRQTEASGSSRLLSEADGLQGGVLNRPPMPREFQLSRHLPAPELASLIEYYWIVRWDLRHRAPHTQETLPQPNIHVVFERGNSQAVGVVSGKFSRCLEGKSHVFGIKFAPGMFRSFLRSAVSHLKDRTMPVREIFDEGVVSLEDILTSQAPDDQLVNAADLFFLLRAPEPDDKADLARKLVWEVLQGRDLLTVDSLVGRSGMDKRSLQRLFNEYVGISPKWVIRRYPPLRGSRTPPRRRTHRLRAARARTRLLRPGTYGQRLQIHPWLHANDLSEDAISSPHSRRVF